MDLREQRAEADRKYFEHVNACPICKSGKPCAKEDKLDDERKKLDDAVWDSDYWNYLI